MMRQRDAGGEQDAQHWRTVDEGWGRRAADFSTLSEPANCREYVALHQHRASRDDGIRRRDLASTSLDVLGPIGRRIHRQQRADLRRNHDNAVRDIARAEEVVANLAAHAIQLTAALPTWRRWQHDHQPEIDRLHAVNRAITDRRVEAGVERTVRAGRAADFGVSL